MARRLQRQERVLTSFLRHSRRLLQQQPDKTSEPFYQKLVSAFQSRHLTAADLGFHFSVLGLCDQPFFQKRIVEVIEPHFFNDDPSFCLVLFVGILSHNVHLQAVCIVAIFWRVHAGGRISDSVIGSLWCYFRIDHRKLHWTEIERKLSKIELLTWSVSFWHYLSNVSS